MSFVSQLLKRKKLLKMNIVRPALPESCRIICVSDIHAYLDDFKSLLKKCSYDPNADYLFILGDIIEKGPDNVSTLNYVQNLCRNPKAIFIQGNNDTMPCHMAYKDDRSRFLDRLKHRPTNTFVQMAEASGITDFTENFEEKRQKVIETYKTQLDFLQSAPLAIETKDFIFVHAAIENRPDWENSAPHVIQVLHWFLRHEHCQPKTVICGHYPTYNFRRGSSTNLPIFDDNKRIIDIDGGMGTKSAMQLNALIININNGGYDFETVFKPHGREVTVKTDYTTDKTPKYVDWENHHISVIEDQGEFLLVKNETTGETGVIPESFTGTWDRLHAWIHLDSFTSVKAGEKFTISRETENHFFGMTQSGKVGFIPKSAVK